MPRKSKNFKDIEKALKKGQSYEDFDSILNEILETEYQDRDLELENLWENNKDNDR